MVDSHVLQAEFVEVQSYGTELFECYLKGLLLKPHHLLGRRPMCILAHTIKFDFNVMKTTQGYLFSGRIRYYQINVIYLQKSILYSMNKHYLLKPRYKKIKCVAYYAIKTYYYADPNAES